MVIEYVSTMHSHLSITGTHVLAWLRMWDTSVLVGHYGLKITETGMPDSTPALTRYSSSQAVLAYADAGEFVEACVVRDHTDPLYGIVTAVAHYEQMP